MIIDQAKIFRLRKDDTRKVIKIDNTNTVSCRKTSTEIHGIINTGIGEMG